jgi:hypothetical protein
MKKHINPIWAASIVWVLIIFASTPAMAAVSGAALLSDCIKNYDRCYHRCYDFDSPYPPTSSVGSCWANCDDNHAACVDRAFGAASKVSRAYRKARRSLFRPYCPRYRVRN